MPIVALLARGAFGLSVLIIVGAAATNFWSAGSYLLALLSVVFFPLTFFIFPWISGLHWVFVIGMVAYMLSNVLGMRPVD